MAKIFKKEREIVTPGEILAEGMDIVAGDGTYRKETKIIAKILGLVKIERRVIKIVPLSGIYMPKVDDTIIGKIIDITISGWRVDFGSPYSAILSIKESGETRINRNNLTKVFNIGDYIITKIISVTSQNLVDLTMKGVGLRKLNRGYIIKVNPHKIPRIIGKGGSMINLLKQETNCKIIAGQNGWIWIDGNPKDEVILIKAIEKIDKESHLDGLTERIRDFIRELKRSIKRSR